jgi:hypothetical protein
MEQIKTDPQLVAYCGLYCGCCRKYLKGSCPGCHGNERASWCGIRNCNIDHGYKSCAECTEFSNPMDCKKFNNFFSKVFAVLFRSDRAACIAKIKSEGYENYASFMAGNLLQSIKRN